MRFRELLMCCLITVTATTAAPDPVHASPSPSVQQLVQQQMRRHPGGIQISTSEVAYAGGTVVIAFRAPLSPSSGGTDCPSNTYCLYDNVGYGYPRLVLSGCGWLDLYPYGFSDHMESGIYNMPGSVSFINHGSRPDHAADTTLFTMGSNKTSMSTTSPYLNVVDHVYRPC